MRHILYVINVDWFFASHFLPFAAEAKRRGFRTSLACEVTTRRSMLEAAGIEVRALELSRGARRATRFWRAAVGLARLIRAARPDIVHAIGLEAVVTTALARRLAPPAQFVFAPTGLGHVATRPGARGSVLRRALPAVLGRFGGADAGWIFENEEDASSFRLGGRRPENVVVVGGAGVDIEAFAPRALPRFPPLRIAQVSRMIWSKGPDLAVEAVKALRRAGEPVELTLVGDPDPHNPRPVPLQRLQEWSASEGIEWHGHCTNVAEVWANHHVACLPSRGGEGLPKSLIEAAACSRLIVTTDVPGCRGLVRDGIEGFIVAPDSPEAVAAALQRILRAPDLLHSMGAAARERVVAGYSDRRIAAMVLDHYEALLGRSSAVRRRT